MVVALQCPSAGMNGPMGLHDLDTLYPGCNANKKRLLDVFSSSGPMAGGVNRGSPT